MYKVSIALTIFITIVLLLGNVACNSTSDTDDKEASDAAEVQELMLTQSPEQTTEKPVSNPEITKTEKPTTTSEETAPQKPTTTKPLGTPKTTVIPETTIPADNWTIPAGSGTMYRAVHMGGNWGSNTKNVQNPPAEYMAYLRDLNVNWVGFSVALHLRDSMDSTVELDYGDIPIATWPDEVIRNLIREFKRHGFNVYIHVAIESGMHGEHPFNRWQLGDPLMHTMDNNILPEFWPWRIDHPQHAEFVAEWWQTYTDCLVHIASIAAEEGVGMMTLGTETDRLFRTRSTDRFPNNFLAELQNLVSSVRNVYTGMIGYEQLHFTLIDQTELGPATNYIHQDLDLDFVAVSSYFPLTDSAPNRVMTVGELEAGWDSVFRQHLLPLGDRNPGKPIIFTEFGYTDVLRTPYEPSAEQFSEKRFKDIDENGLDDGEEQQSNCIEAFYNVLERFDSNIEGAFLWDVYMSTQEEYDRSFGQMRTFNIRSKLAEEIVRTQYAEWR